MFMAMSAIMNAMDWWEAMGTPKVLRSVAYCTAYSMAARERPTAAEATEGRV